MKVVLFKLFNRLRLWHPSWLEEAVNSLPGDASMLKEIAIYVESHSEKEIGQLGEA